MNFEEAIAAHADWKTKLREYLHAKDKSLRPDEVGRDDGCGLGKWIHGEGTKFSTLSEFREVKAAHAAFHKAAADVVRRANTGAETAAETVLGAKSSFMSASSAVVKALVALKSKVRS